MNKKLKDFVKKNIAPASTFGTNPSDPWSTKANLSEGSLETYLKSRGINPEYVSKDQKIAHSKSNAFKAWLRNHQLESVQIEEATDHLVTSPTKKRLADLRARQSLHKEIGTHSVKEAYGNEDEEFEEEEFEEGESDEEVEEESEETEIEESRGHKVISTFFKNRELMKKSIDDSEKAKGHAHDTHDRHINDRVTDTLVGRVPGGKDNEHFSYKVDIKKEAAEVTTDMIKGRVVGGKPNDFKSFKVKMNSTSGAGASGIKVSEEVEPLTEESDFHPDVHAELKKHTGKIGAIIHNTKDNALAAVVHDTNDNGLSGNHHVHFFVNNKKVHTTIHPTFGDAESHAVHTITSKKGLKHLGKMHTLMEEQIDELSKPMLATYIRRASDPTHPKSNVNLASLAADKLAKGGKDDGEADDRKAYKRSRGIGLAAAKMAREDVEQVEEDTFQDAKAATQTVGMETESKKKLIKSLVSKKRKMSEEMYDHEKEDKSVQTYGKKPKMEKAEKEDSGVGEKKPHAVAVMSGGTTLTGQKRDVVELDPMMRNRPGQPDVTKKDDKKDDKKKEDKKQEAK